MSAFIQFENAVPSAMGRAEIEVSRSGAVLAIPTLEAVITVWLTHEANPFETRFNHQTRQRLECFTVPMVSSRLFSVRSV
ncbi:MAG: hypothetical protein FWD57_10195 [Polyangiaceae bacterium]|nr:hypothetical protein [Polyangiaceae bacterium]